MIKRISVILVMLSSLATVAFAQTEACETTRWYCVEGLNDGLDAPGDIIAQDTPRAAIESLLFFAERDAWGYAAHLLDLSNIPEEEQAVRGAELARALDTVISRKAVIDWDLVRDRPDGIDAQASSDQAMAGEPRKSLLLWTLDLGARPAAIRLARVKPDGGEPVWVFSRQTVDNIPALFERYGPNGFEAYLPAALTEKTAVGFMWWEIIGLPILMVLALLVGRWVWVTLNWVSGRVERRVIKDIVRSVRGPAATGAATGLALLIGSSVFVFSGQISTILTPVAWLGLLASGLWFIINAVEVVLDRLTQFDDVDLTNQQDVHMRTTATRVAAARRAFVVVVILVGGGVFLSQTNIFQNLGLTLLGTAGALTLVLGFAARRVLGNIMASLQIALNQSARIGDRIVYNDYLCHVERINFTYVQLRDWDGTRLVVPVEEFVSTAFENWTMKEPEMLRIIKVKCAHDADVGLLRDAFMGILDELDQDQLGDRDSAKVRVAGQDVFGKDVWFALPCSDPNTSWDVACDARERLLAAGTRIAEDRNVVIFPDANAAEAA
ncbi:mechanosensitive ion channel family protein [uncultured Tateyamaria sp.]|uniref:mechanosensitive ion channel family protein n=1 Tax=uncultured Tateyamaria sp. TaxID=455651 RepID=UPI0026097149|nr:mechanosensitive ion channel domain-containing protein [uncultured Tateyamaria sp.]